MTPPRSLRVLVVEDSEDDLLMLLRMIRMGGYEPTWRRVVTAAEMEAALAAEPWDIVVADYSLPGFSGLTALDILRRHDGDLPFLLVSGTIGEEIAVAAMRAGARDYLMKGNLARLAPAIDRELAQAQHRRERRRLEEELRQAQKMEAVGRLAGGVAHDFNNLLTAINGYADLVLMGMDPEDASYAEVQEIRHAGERATSLTRQLLAFGRRQVLAPRAMDLSELVAGVVPMLQRLIGEDVELVLSSDGAVATVLVDSGQIEQVVVNLVVNARDAMPGGGRLTIETRAAAFDERISDQRVDVEAGRYVMLAVSDTGIGMDAETADHVFEPFFTTKPPGKGTGLGLATVWGIVRQSGGHVWFYSEPGVGTTFKVYLPLIEGPAERLAGPPSARRLGGGSETILIVEDEPAVRALVLRVLEQQGYRTIVAEDAESALVRARAHPGTIDLLVSDVIMPGIGGPALAEQLRAERPHVKVLFVSGYTDDAIVHHGVLAQGVAFLQKPFTPESLGRRVRDMLDATDAPVQA